MTNFKANYFTKTTYFDYFQNFLYSDKHNESLQDLCFYGFSFTNTIPTKCKSKFKNKDSRMKNRVCLMLPTKARG